MDEAIADIQLHNFRTLFDDSIEKPKNLAKKYAGLFKTELVIEGESLDHACWVDNGSMGSGIRYHTQH